MQKSRINFIKEAHANACSKWQKRISDEFPEIFAKDVLELNNWYWIGGISKDTRMLVYVLSQPSYEHEAGVDTVLGYGFNFKGNYHGKSTWGIDYSDYERAEKHNVESMLLDEAVQRGFVIGAKYIDRGDNITQEIKGTLHCYFGIKNQITDGYGGHIFYDGVWSELIHKPKEEDLTYSHQGQDDEEVWFDAKTGCHWNVPVERDFKNITKA